MSSQVCNNCGSSDIDTDTARGDAVCTSCGSVLEEHIIVSEVQFSDNAMGASSVIGQFVASDAPKTLSLGTGFHHGVGKESRAITLHNGKKRIQGLGKRLHLNQHCLDTAFNFFKMAVARRVTIGRKSMHVAAACLYLVCRTEGTSHMLLDFADLLQTSVYSLGKTYTQLAKELSINLPPLEPYLYVERFANQLEYGDKTLEVSNTALRLVSRMKRDWMAQGRRPNGLCGAALLVASRIHDFSRTIKDIIKVVKIGEGTIRKRLSEFEQTASSSLTIDEFTKIDLEEESDPPCYTEGRKKAKFHQLEEMGKLPELTDEIISLQNEIDEEIEKMALKRAGRFKSLAANPSGVGSTTSETPSIADLADDLSECNKFIEEETMKEILKDVNADSDQCGSEQSPAPSTDREAMPPPASLQCSPGSLGLGLGASRPTAATLGIPSADECIKQFQKKEESDEEEEIVNNCELDLTDLDDEELDKYILKPDEVVNKTKIWTRANADYLKELKLKLEKQAQEMAEGGKAKQDAKKKKRKKRPAKEANTAKEAFTKMLQEKKISDKINYDVLTNLNQTSSHKVEGEAGPAPVKLEGKKAMDALSSLIGQGPVMATPVNIPSSKSRRLPSLRSAPELKKEPPFKKPKLNIEEEKPPEVLIESGPVQYEPEDELEEDEEEEEEHMSAAQLMGHSIGDDDYGDEDDYL